MIRAQARCRQRSTVHRDLVTFETRCHTGFSGNTEDFFRSPAGPQDRRIISSNDSPIRGIPSLPVKSTDRMISHQVLPEITGRSVPGAPLLKNPCIPSSMAVCAAYQGEFKRMNISSHERRLFRASGNLERAFERFRFSGSWSKAYFLSSLIAFRH